MTASPSLDGKTSVTNPRAVPARHAASLLVVRNRPSGLEVLMGVRRPGHRFLPNQLVFPGGAVDPSDRTLAAATEPNPTLMAALQRQASPILARALAMAAARELAEETGLSLGESLHAPPRLDRLHYLCRAITPTRLPIRFNARFLVTTAEAVRGEPADNQELHSVRFIPISEALQMELLFVTREVLGKLSTWLARGGADVDTTSNRTDVLSTPWVLRNRKWRPD
jgi:8-oxo-dGTP pyrophosphatase MutT (NUDIX family)